MFYRFAYVEFADKDSAKTALALDESLFKGRQLKVGVLCTSTYTYTHTHKQTQTHTNRLWLLFKHVKTYSLRYTVDWRVFQIS